MKQYEYLKSRSSRKIQFAKLHCPMCYSADISVDVFDNYQCRYCYTQLDFKKLLNLEQMRVKKIDSIIK